MGRLIQGRCDFCGTRGTLYRKRTGGRDLKLCKSCIEDLEEIEEDD